MKKLRNPVFAVNKRTIVGTKIVLLYYPISACMMLCWSNRVGLKTKLSQEEQDILAVACRGRQTGEPLLGAKDLIGSAGTGHIYCERNLLVR